MENYDPKTQKGGFGKKNIAYILLGIVIALTGYSVWKNPHLDIHSMIESMSHIFSHGVALLSFLKMEVLRLVEDPFAIIGIFLMGGGLLMIYEGITRK